MNTKGFMMALSRFMGSRAQADPVRSPLQQRPSAFATKRSPLASGQTARSVTRDGSRDDAKGPAQRDRSEEPGPRLLATLGKRTKRRER